jgi:hypothetical protein
MGSVSVIASAAFSDIYNSAERGRREAPSEYIAGWMPESGLEERGHNIKGANVSSKDSSGGVIP